MEEEGRWTEVTVLAFLVGNERRRYDPIELFHGLRALRLLSQGYLRAVEEFDASLRIVQQPVLSEINRVHAEHQRYKGSKWCAGCHDHAVFFNGRFEKPIKDQIDTPEAQNGLGCVSCHSITRVDSTMGNGGFTIEYPPLHDLASSRNKYIRAMDYFLTYLDPEPHRKTFMKPFMRLDSAEYCSTCHKVHLDVPVNNYRWIRGFNDYDNWQASGVSGQGARSFYYPPKTSTCAQCHMPLVKSNDPGNRDGMIHSHRFAAANTAVAYVNKDEKQLEETKSFLTNGFISVDIFSASAVDSTPGQPDMRRRSEGPQLASTFAVGEESEQSGNVFLRDVGKLVGSPRSRGHEVPARIDGTCRCCRADTTHRPLLSCGYRGRV